MVAHAYRLLERLRQEDHWSPEVEVTVNYDRATAFQPGQQRKILSLKKFKILTRCGGAHLQSQLLGRLRQED